MRVLNIMSRFNVGGTSQWLLNLSKGLDEHGIENLLAVGNCPGDEHENEGLSLISHVRVAGLGPRTSISSSFAAFLELRKIIKRFKPDLVNTHTSKAGLIGRLASKSVYKNVKVIHTYHGHVLSGYFSKPLESLIEVAEKFLSLFTDFFFVSGEIVADEIREAGISRSKPVIRVWPAVPDFKISSRETLRAKINIPTDAFVIGWLGRKVPIKRIDRVIELAKCMPKYYFLVAGDGPNARETFREMFKDDNLYNFIELGISNPSDIWAISDICLLTSDNEAMPISPIEASLSGRPVVATNAGSTSEVVKNGETGFLCSMDVQQLESAIERLANDETLRVSMGLKARNFALETFSPLKSVERQIEGYRAALRI